MFAKMVMGNFYRQADGDPTKLPWHDETLNPLLTAAVRSRRGGRALDLGCGAGVFATWMAENGMRVTAVDLFEEAIAMCRSRARELSVEVELVHADLFELAPAEPFDLVFDSGCLHSLVGGNARLYVDKLRSWLRPGGRVRVGTLGQTPLDGLAAHRANASLGRGGSPIVRPRVRAAGQEPRRLRGAAPVRSGRSRKRLSVSTTLRELIALRQYAERDAHHGAPVPIPSVRFR